MYTLGGFMSMYGKTNKVLKRKKKKAQKKERKKKKYAKNKALNESHNPKKIKK